MSRQRPWLVVSTLGVVLVGILAALPAPSQSARGGSSPTGCLAAPNGGPHGPPPGRVGPPPLTAEMLMTDAKLIALLELSEEQLDSLRDLATVFRTEIREVHEELKQAHDALEQAFSANPLLEDAVWRATSQVSELRSDLLVREIDYRLQTLQLLTAEQRQQLSRRSPARGPDRHGDR
ncbi:MAG: Spy/CpxP family protein refolding chaperone [bacterium]